MPSRRGGRCGRDDGDSGRVPCRRASMRCVHTRTVTVSNDSELARLESIATDGLYNTGPMPRSLKHLARIFSRHWRGTRCLELGPAEGIVTEELVGAFP